MHNNHLRDLKILILDADQSLSNVLKDMMRGMGFRNIAYTPSGRKALSMMEDTPPDFLIMDWNVKEFAGNDFINSVRKNALINNPSLPIIMLTPQTDTSDTMRIRNKGVNEYMTKPFSAQTVFNKLEHIVQHPRYFVVADSYVGPDRRSKKEGAPGGKNSRTAPLLPERRPSDPQQLFSGTKPRLWLPDFSLKHKIGQNVTLESLITADLLNQTQIAIDQASPEAQSIKKDIAAMFTIYRSMVNGSHSDMTVNEMNEMALIVSARAGTLGYLKASEVAYMLYMFCRNALNFSNKTHLEIVEKHLLVLKLMFSANLHDATEQLAELMTALRNVANKYR